jgi:hypothetical protein
MIPREKNIQRELEPGNSIGRPGCKTLETLHSDRANSERSLLPPQKGQKNTPWGNARNQTIRGSKPWFKAPYAPPLSPRGELFFDQLPDWLTRELECSKPVGNWTLVWTLPQNVGNAVRVRDSGKHHNGPGATRLFLVVQSYLYRLVMLHLHQSIWQTPNRQLAQARQNFFAAAQQSAVFKGRQ